jgi:hypothetical protein
MKNYIRGDIGSQEKLEIIPQTVDAPVLDGQPAREIGQEIAKSDSEPSGR